MNKTYEDKISRAEEIYLKRQQERKLNKQNRIYNEGQYNNYYNYNKEHEDKNNNSYIRNNSENKNLNIAEYNIKEKENNDFENDNKRYNNVYNMEDYYNLKYNQENELKRKNKQVKRKIIKFIWTLFNIYIIVLMFQYRDQVFNQNIVDKMNGFLNYNINIVDMCKEYINKDKDENENDDNNSNIDNNVNNNIFNNSMQENKQLENNTNLNESSLTYNNENNNGESCKLDTDISNENYIDEKIRILNELKENSIVPVEGIVTSEFGAREASSNIISTNHKGIDIGAKENEPIKASIDGFVTDARYSTSYGNLIKIKKVINDKEIINLYAHCKEIYVHINDYINKGQEIATVGSTGNSTGPHLHFEVIYNGEYINPREVLNI